MHFRIAAAEKDSRQISKTILLYKATHVALKCCSTFALKIFCYLFTVLLFRKTLRRVALE